MRTSLRAGFFLCATGLALNIGGKASAEPPQSWTLDLEDQRSRVTFELNLIRRLPRLHALNDTFERSIRELFDEVSRLASELDFPRDTFRLRPMPVTGMVFTDDGQSLGYDEAGLAAIRAQLIVRAHSLFDSIKRSNTPLHPKELGKDLIGFDEKAPGSFFELTPFFYDQSGKSKYDDLTLPREQDRFVESLYGLTGADLEWYGTVLTKLGTTDDAAVARRFKTAHNAFFERWVRPKLIRVDGRGEPAEETKLSLEEVHPLVAMVRGAIGLDCSMNSVAFYALVRGAKVYFIRTSHRLGDQPVGYAITLPVKHHGRTIPLVVTINGPGVKAAAVGPVLDLISHLWKTNTVALPTKGDHAEVLNYPEIAAEYKAQADSESEVTVPKDWLELDEYLNDNSDVMEFANAYDVGENKVIPAMIRRVRRAVQPIELPPSDGYVPVDLRKAPLLRRAEWAARMLRYDDEGDDVDQDVSELLDLNEGQLAAARGLFETWEDKDGIDADLFLESIEALGIKPVELIGHMELLELAQSLVNVIEDDEDRAQDAGWTALAEALFEKFEVEIERAKTLGQTKLVRTLAHARDGLGDIFAHVDGEKTWQELYADGHFERGAAESPRYFRRLIAEGLSSGQHAEFERALRAMSHVDASASLALHDELIEHGLIDPEFILKLSPAMQNEFLNRVPALPRRFPALARQAWMRVYLAEKDPTRARALRTLMKRKFLWSDLGIILSTKKLGVRDVCGHLLGWRRAR